MATTAAPLQPSKPAVLPPNDKSKTPDSSTSQTSAPASASQRGEPQGFGILQHTGPPIQDEIPGLYRDGRVRNPVPSKLKGRTDVRNGNFGVMHIDLTTTNETQERDAAAKRTSEGTQLAAKLAQTDRYVPIKRSKFVYRPDEQAAPSPPPQPTGPRHITSPLTAAETKAEQARLLTLLRSLHPVLVVDQLCKALAFFGGIPGAQVSSDGCFPDSAEANGSGSLFIGWLAEIFPSLGQGLGSNAQKATLKRPRGRPKGSKNAKGKKDKVVIKSLALGSHPMHASESHHLADGVAEETPADDSWVDIEEAATANEEGGSEETRQKFVAREAATPSVNTRSLSGPCTLGVASGGGDVEASASTPTPRRRGRPKGSRNRPKDAAAKKTDAAVAPETTDISESGVPVRKRKPGPGRPKGSKNRPKEIAVREDSLSGPTAQHTESRNDETRLDVSRVDRQMSSTLVPAPIASAEPVVSVPNIPAPETQEPAAQPPAAKYNTGSPKGLKRKRKALTTDKVTKVVGPPSATAQTTFEGIDDAAVDFSSGGLSSQSVGYSVTSTQKSTAMQQPGKRQKVPNDLPQRPPLTDRACPPISDTQLAPAPTDLHTTQSLASVDDYGAHPISGDTAGRVSRSKNQISMAVNHSPLPKIGKSQPASSDMPSSHMQVSYGQRHGSSGGNTQQTKANTQTPTGPYSMALGGRPSQGIYSQAHPAQGQYGQYQQQLRQQQQESRQQVSAHSHSGANQHHLMSSQIGQQMSSTAGHDASPFNGSAGEGYHGLASISQPSPFGTQVTAAGASPNNSYGNSASRSVQNHSPALHTLQTHHAPNSSMSSFHHYSDPAFLELTDLDSAGQAGLASMGQTSYSLSGAAVQRPSSTVNSAYNSATSMGHSSFSGGITESTFRGRIYDTLRR